MILLLPASLFLCCLAFNLFIYLLRYHLNFKKCAKSTGTLDKVRKAFLIAILPVKPRPEMQLNLISCLAGDKVLGQVSFSRGKTARDENARKRSCTLCLQFHFLYFNFPLSSKYQHLTWISGICRKISISAFWRGSICPVYNHSKGIQTFLFVLHYTKTYNLEVRNINILLESFNTCLLKYLSHSLPPQNFLNS